MKPTTLQHNPTDGSLRISHNLPRDKSTHTGPYSFTIFTSFTHSELWNNDSTAVPSDSPPGLCSCSQLCCRAGAARGCCSPATQSNTSGHTNETVNGAQRTRDGGHTEEQKSVHRTDCSATHSQTFHDICATDNSQELGAKPKLSAQTCTGALVTRSVSILSTLKGAATKRARFTSCLLRGNHNALVGIGICREVDLDPLLVFKNGCEFHSQNAE